MPLRNSIALSHRILDGDWFLLYSSAISRIETRPAVYYATGSSGCQLFGLYPAHSEEGPHRAPHKPTAQGRLVAVAPAQ